MYTLLYTVVILYIFYYNEYTCVFLLNYDLTFH